jgi:2-polyprenyl-6-methoxyphenol hydroxylase-like FAD-dependent oxidoreductase
MAYRVAVVGSGSAGPATAIFLARAGHEVVLYEKAPEELAVGAGFLLQPTGLAVLRELNLHEEVLKVAERINGLYCETKKGGILLDLKYAELEEGMFGLGTHRASFLRILLRGMEQAGASVSWGAEAVDLREKEGRRHLIFENGREEGPFDLVVLADGARSRLRKKTGIPCRVDRYPWGALWFVGKRSPEFARDQLWQKVGTTRELCGFLPTGTDEDLLSLFWSVRIEDPLPPLSAWKERVASLVPQAAAFLEQVTSINQLQRASYHDVRMRCWHAPGIAVLGDAAHALSPQLGQGVNLALVDAAVLAACLDEFALDQALEEYTVRRKGHVGFYQFATRWTTPFFQSDHLWLGKIRDLGFPLGMKLGWVRNQMTTTMAGLKAGFFATLER